jgi:predicted transcriptional regulator with HTH domain
LINKAIRILEKEVKSITDEILLAEVKQHSDKRRETKIAKLTASIAEKQADIAGFKKKLSDLPEKVSIVDILKGKPMSRSDLEKKKLYDLMQFMAYNSRERLVEFFRECYDDHRDVKQVLDMITRRSGYVKLVGQTLIVVLDWIKNQKHRQADERFCHLLNQKALTLTGRLSVKLAFYISRYPLHSTCLEEIPDHNQS